MYTRPRPIFLSQEELDLVREAMESFQAGLQDAKAATTVDRTVESVDELTDAMSEYNRRKQVGDSIEKKIQEAYNAAGG